ncbi:MAG: hypothetical protein NVSMB1_05790 [Polyangiales bacterium]
MRSLTHPLAFSVASLLLTACGARVDGGPTQREPQVQPQPQPQPQPKEPPARTPADPKVDIAQRAYDAKNDGFVVHEWGTLTSVVGSDGSLQPGLHHEEEDLPAFVADRMKQVHADANSGVLAVNAKMETPVTYFYSPTARSVTARVYFPHGIFTQWYPFVKSMSPPVVRLLDGSLADRPLQTAAEIPPACRFEFSDAPLANGLLDWASVDILPRETSVAFPGGLGNTTWGYARNTASNALKVGSQAEKFLFYRGLGNYDYPVKLGFARKEGASGWRALLGRGAQGSMFVMNVSAAGANFAEIDDVAFGKGSSAAVDIPNPSLNHHDFVATLKAKLAARLVSDGLYTDEALAMVDTWERSYFLTPGVRVLYLLPESAIDALIPLEITPRPDVMKRTMVIRVELMTPDYEHKLQGWLTDLASADAKLSAQAKGNFLSLGRFAEPHLTRVASMATNAAEKAASDALLTEVRGKRRWAPTAAE